MSDIVDRLRDPLRRTSALRDEAADTIERLRDVVWRDGNPWWCIDDTQLSCLTCDGEGHRTTFVHDPGCPWLAENKRRNP